MGTRALTEEKLAYAKFLSLPRNEEDGIRDHEGNLIDNDTKFANFIGVSTGTLSKWRKDQKFMGEVFRQRARYLDSYVPDMLAALRHKATHGRDVPAIKLALEYLGQFMPVSKIIEEKIGGVDNPFTSPDFLEFFVEAVSEKIIEHPAINLSMGEAQDIIEPILIDLLSEKED